MATLTNAELDAMSFGYLTGADLAMFSSYQIIIKQFETSQSKLQIGCTIAYQEVTNMFLTKYDVKRELNTISGPREMAFVKFVAISALKNILGNMAGEGTVTEKNFAWHDEQLLRIQDGVDNFSLYAPSIPCIESNAFLVRQNFGLRG